MNEINLVVHTKTAENESSALEQLKTFHEEIRGLSRNTGKLLVGNIASHYHITEPCLSETDYVDIVLPMKFFQEVKNNRFHIFICAEDSVKTFRLFEKIVSEYYPLLELKMKSEGNGFFINTDKSGIYFPERYLVTMYGAPEFEKYSDKNYFTTMQEVMSFLVKFLNRDELLNSLESAESTADILMAKYGGHIYIHKFNNI